MVNFNGRLRRPAGDHVLLQARITPTTRGLIVDAAAASGVTHSLYVESLLMQIVAANDGRLPLVSVAQPELPIDREGDAVTPAA